MLTQREMRAIARMVADEIRAELRTTTDKMMGLREVAQEFGWKSKFIYQNARRLGGVKAGKSWMFSRRQIMEAISTGLLSPEMREEEQQ